MTAASGKINLQKSKHDRTHVAKVKAAFHSWCNKHDVIQHASQEKHIPRMTFLCIQYSLQIKRFNNTKRQYIFY